MPKVIYPKVVKKIVTILDAREEKQKPNNTAKMKFLRKLEALSQGAIEVKLKYSENYNLRLQKCKKAIMDYRSHIGMPEGRVTRKVYETKVKGQQCKKTIQGYVKQARNIKWEETTC